MGRRGYRISVVAPVLVTYVLGMYFMFNMPRTWVYDNEETGLSSASYTHSNADIAVAPVEPVFIEDALNYDGTLLEQVKAYAYDVAERGGYGEIRLFEACMDSTEIAGAFHLTFDTWNYICVWISENGEPIELYNCKLTQRLIDNWEYN